MASPLASSALLLALSSPFAASVPSASPAVPETLHGSRLSARTVRPGGLVEQIAASRGRQGLTWLAYGEPVLPGSERVCCFDGRRKGASACRLWGGNVSVSTNGDPGPRPIPIPSDAVHIFLGVEAGEVRRIRAFSGSCRVEVADAELVWLEGVPEAESVALLTAIASRDSRHLIDESLMALALHETPLAMTSLERLLARGNPAKTREQAAFWLGQMRGEPGYQAVKQAVLADESPSFRRHGTFVISQSKSADAAPTLVSMAHRDPAAEVRSQALFWLAQMASDRAVGAIDESLRDDPDDEVKEQAVFALTQLPKDQGVPHLLKVARTHSSKRVRKQAIFWLGQSDDPRALQFLEEVLLRR